MSQVQIGQLVPDFTAKIVNDKSIQLSDYVGQYVLLYFYPKDNTPGCTQQAQMFRDAIDQFTALNTVILGVSRDSVRSHENFKTKHCLPFDLIADADESLCQLFDVIKMKSMYGKQVRGIERSSFLIDPDRLLIQEWRKVKVKEHCDQVLQMLHQIKG